MSVVFEVTLARWSKEIGGIEYYKTFCCSPHFGCIEEDHPRRWVHAPEGSLCRICNDTMPFVIDRMPAAEASRKMLLKEW